MALLPGFARSRRVLAASGSNHAFDRSILVTITCRCAPLSQQNRLSTAPFAKAFGAEVTGVCSTTKTDLVRSIGADHAIDYIQEDFANGQQHYDVILDTAGNRSLSHIRRALTPQGTLVIVGGEGGGRWFGAGRQLRAFMLSPFVRQTLCSFVSMKRSKEDLEFIKNLVEAGQVMPVIDRRYTLSETAEAIRYWAKGHARGKIVITM
jgi:NADPH:quinone reductase-like Zn-dependent oxidoreductase